MSIDRIREIEERAAHAWPAELVEELDGWRLRFAHGVSGRANSVWPARAGEGYTLDERIARVEEFYDQRCMPARYQISPAAQPPGLDLVLADRGYTRVAPTLVQVAPSATIVERLAGVAANPAVVRDTLDELWLRAFTALDDASEERADVLRGIFGRIASATAYARVEVAGRVVAVGLGVTEQDWCGIFCVVTDPDFRRQGAACAVLEALAREACERGVTGLYLQVTEHNVPARTLYARLGFETLYSYHYRVANGEARIRPS